MPFRFAVAVAICTGLSLSGIQAANGQSGVTVKSGGTSAFANPPGFGVLRVSDAAGGLRELLYGGTLDPSENPESYSLPPPPPAGTFDVRYENDSRLLQNDEEVFRVQSSNYPIQISVSLHPDTLAARWSVEELPLGWMHQLTLDSSFVVTNPAVTRFRLKRSDSAVDLEAQEFPVSFAVQGNYPNPFVESTTMVLDLPSAAEVEVSIFDVLGRLAMRLPVTTIGGGSDRRLPIDGSTLASGIYSYRVRARMHATTEVGSGRMIIVR